MNNQIEELPPWEPWCKDPIAHMKEMYESFQKNKFHLQERLGSSHKKPKVKIAKKPST